MSDVNEQTPAEAGDAGESAEVMTTDAPAPAELTQDLIAQLPRMRPDGTFSGREVHEFLQVRTQYSKWFERMVSYDFVNGVDFGVDSEVYGKNAINPPSTGGRPSVDHWLTANMAKQLCMLQRTPRARQARLYFIACEERLHAGVPAGLTAEQVERLIDDRLAPLTSSVTSLTTQVTQLVGGVQAQTAQVTALLTARAAVRNPGVMTVDEYARSLGRRLTEAERSVVGKIATGMAKEAGVVPTQLSIPGSVKRAVNEYPLRFLVPALAEFDAKRLVRKRTKTSAHFADFCRKEDACRAQIGKPPVHADLLREYDEQRKAAKVGKSNKST